MALDPRTQTAYQAGARETAAIDEGLRSYMLRVYNYMSLGVAVTGIVTLFMAANPALMQTIAIGPFKWVLFIGVLGMGWFSNRIMTMRSTVAAQAFYWTYAVMWGLLISPMIYYFLQIPGGTMDIAKAFFITAGMFAGASLFGYTTKKDLSAFGRFFMMASIGLLIAIVANIFLGSTMFSLGISFFAVLLFAGVTAWETQAIRNMYFSAPNGDVVTRMAIFGAFMLYGSFIVMFIHILNIIGIMRGE